MRLNNELTNDYVADDAEVLIEKLPIRYELKNIERTKWRNITDIKTVTISHEHLKNPEKKSKLITKEVQYSTNHSIKYEFPSNVLANRELRLFKEDKIQRLNTLAPPESTIEHKSIRVERRVAPKWVQDLKVTGTLSKILYEIQGDFVKIYDDDEKESDRVKIQVIETNLLDVKVEDITSAKMDARGADAVASDKHHEGYTGFEIWVIISFCLFFGTILIAFTDVAVRLYRGKEGGYKSCY